MSRAKSIPLGAQGFLIAICTLPVMLPFVLLNESGRGWNAWLFTMILVGIVRVRWELRGYIWFWLTVVGLLGLHVPLILWAPWTNVNYLGMAMAPVILVDFAVVYGVIKIAEMLFRQNV